MDVLRSQTEMELSNVPGSSDGKESACNAGDHPGSGRSRREGNGNPLRYSCLENSMDRGALQATVYGVAKESDMTERLTHIHTVSITCIDFLSPYIPLLRSNNTSLATLSTLRQLDLRGGSI